MENIDKFKNRYLQDLLRNIAAVYLITNQNRFRIIAYEKAADTVEHLSRELKDIWQEGKLDEVPTLGKTLTAHLEEYFSTGTSKHFDEILAQIPHQVFTLMKVPSIGPKKGMKLVNELKLDTSKDILHDVLKAAKDNKIAIIPTFGEKSQADILEAIERYQKSSQKEERMPLPFAGDLAKEIIEYLKQNKHIQRFDALGSLRRQVSTIGDVDIAVEAEKQYSDEIVQHFIKYPGTIHVDNLGHEKASIFVAGNRRVDLRVQTKETYGSMLQYFTGSKQHNIKLREFALKKGLSLNEYGIKQIKDEKLLTFDTEEKFYNHLGLQYVEPELREGSNEIEFAKREQLPPLVKPGHIKGDLHMHSSYDIQTSHDVGKNSYQELLQNAEHLGYEYIGFADHNPKIGDLTDNDRVEILKKRHHHIHSTLDSQKFKTKYFIGLEVDILPDGNLAFPEKGLEFVDYLIVSIHSSFNLSMKEMTTRVLRALSFPKVKILGHPTGRLLNKREGYELNWQEIFEYVKQNNIALEINSFPSRLDLPDSLVREGLDYGVKYCIDTDSHAVEHMSLMPYGVSVARRGWCTKNDIVNTLEYNKFKEFLI